jgi:hypothetical protein
MRNNNWKRQEEEKNLRYRREHYFSSQKQEFESNDYRPREKRSHLNRQISREKDQIFSRFDGYWDKISENHFNNKITLSGKFPSPNPPTTFSEENPALDDSNEAIFLVLTEQPFASVRQLSRLRHLP